MTSKSVVTIDGKTGFVEPSAERIRLSSIKEVRVEMAAIYRLAKRGSIDPQTAGRLAYILTQVGKLIEIEKIEPRIRELEERLK